MSELVADRGPISLRVDRAPDAAFIAQLEATRFGSGGLRYYRLRAADLYAGREDSWFFSILHRDTVIGTYILTETRLSEGDNDIRCVYRGGLTLRPDHQQQGIAAWAMDTALGWLGRHLTFALSYGLIESGNDASRQLLRSRGSTLAGTLRTHLLYRQWPGTSRRVVTVSEPAVSAQLHNTVGAGYQWHQQAAPGDRTFGVMDGNQLTAVASTKTIRLNLSDRRLSLAGAYSTLVSLLPPARRRFDPCDFQYLSLSRVLVDPGHPGDLAELVSHLMAVHGVHMASLSLDPTGPTYRTLETAGFFGAFAKATRTDSEIHLLGAHDDVPPVEGPVQLSAPDM